MTAQRARIGDALVLSREPIVVSAAEEYRRIGIYSWGKGFLHRPPIHGLEMGGMRYFTIPSGALVLSNIQAWEAALGVSGEAERGHVASNRFLPYVPIDENRVSVRFLLHYFLSEVGLGKLRQASPGTQVRNRTLGKGLFEAIEVPLPEIDEQRRIAAHLDSVARDVGTLRALQVRISVKRTLKALASECILDVANESWSEGVHFQIRGGSTPEPNRHDLWDGDVPWITPTDIGALGGRGVRAGARDVSDLVVPRAGLIPSGSVVMTSRAPIGNLAIAERPLLTNQGCKSFVPLIEIDPTYLYFSVMSVLDAITSAGVGTTFQEVSARTLSRLSLPGCSPHKQRRVASVLATIQDRLQKVEAAARRADMATSALLPAARNEIFSAMR